MLLILQILETASMNEVIRGHLSEKKKIKDLFLVVISSIQISSNKALVSSLIQFISNLCYGQGKLKQMLAKEAHSDFIKTLKSILFEIKTPSSFEESENSDKENKDPMAKKNFERKDKADKSLLKQSIYNLIGNLCIEKSLRQSFASDTEGVLS